MPTPLNRASYSLAVLSVASPHSTLTMPSLLNRGLDPRRQLLVYFYNKITKRIRLMLVLPKINYLLQLKREMEPYHLL